MPIILGIDPGSRITGFGVIRHEYGKNQYITSGCIRVTETGVSLRLKQIFDGITEIMGQYRPEESAIEQVFMHTNAGGAIKLGQARGVAIAAIAAHAVPVEEYSARQIKKAVVGYGGAEKEQVQHMVKTMLQLNKTPQADAADALAIALCHAYTRQGLQNLGQGVHKMRYGRLR